MRSTFLLAAGAVLLPSITNAALDCGSSLTASGNDWTVTCDYVLEAETEQLVEGEPDLESCLEACVEGKDCYGVNFAPNGSCILASGDEQGTRKQTGYTNLIRIADSTAASTSTSEVKITSTILGPGALLTTLTSVTNSKEFASTVPASTATSSALPSASSGTTGSDTLCSVDLDLEYLCPTCNDELAIVQGKYYRIACDSELTKPDNGTYALQESVSPGACMEECNSLPFCQGASYFDYEDCVIAKGSASATAHPSYTAFIPVAAPTATQLISSYPTGTFTPITTSTTSKAATSSTSEPTFSILPVPSDCDQSAPMCPECGGYHVEDKLNASYTMACWEPVCDSTGVWASGKSQEACLEGCDQDVTCLAAVWYASNMTCNLCQQGLQSSNSTEYNLPYVVFIADTSENDEDDKSFTLPQHLASKRGSVGRITDLPTPFDAESRVQSTTLGPRLVIPKHNPGGPIINLTSAVLVTAPRPIVTDTISGGTIVVHPTSAPYPLSNATSPTGGSTVNVTLTPPSTVSTKATSAPYPFSNTTFPTGGSTIKVTLTPPSSVSAVPITGFNPGGPIKNITSTRTSSSPTVSTEIPNITNLPPVSCPFYDGDVYINSDGDYFEIMCNGLFDAAHSRYLSASDLPACVASCSGDCDGVQFGYTTRCGLYTSIFEVVSASGWTIAAMIELPTSVPALSTSVSTSKATAASAGTGFVPTAASTGVVAP